MPHVVAHCYQCKEKFLLGTALMNHLIEKHEAQCMTEARMWALLSRTDEDIACHFCDNEPLTSGWEMAEHLYVVHPEYLGRHNFYAAARMMKTMMPNWLKVLYSTEHRELAVRFEPEADITLKMIQELTYPWGPRDCEDHERAVMRIEAGEETNLTVKMMLMELGWIPDDLPEGWLACRQRPVEHRVLVPQWTFFTTAGRLVYSVEEAIDHMDREDYSGAEKNRLQTRYAQ